MSTALATLPSGMLAALAQGAMPRPFVDDLMLVECHVAGTSYVALDDVEPQLAPGQILTCRREPQNAHDALAILILDAQGRKLGYVPRAKNEVLARLMDAGKHLFARLEAKAWRNEWLRLDVRVYLRDY